MEEWRRGQKDLSPHQALNLTRRLVHLHVCISRVAQLKSMHTPCVALERNWADEVSSEGFNTVKPAIVASRFSLVSCVCPVKIRER